MGFLKDLFMLKYLPNLAGDAGLWLVFLFGVLTSFHCVGMCGGIALSQTAGKADGKAAGKRLGSVALPSALYNLGRIISYTVVGAIAGGLGQIIGVSGAWRGVIPIVGGVFMIIMAVNLLDIFPFLRRLTIRPPKFIARKVLGANNYGPFVIGLLMGLMPCGSLQTVQLYALGTKSVFYGAAAMLTFALGTVPLLFSFGLLNTFLSKKFSRVITRVSTVLVLILGVVMIGRGLALAGVNTTFGETPGDLPETIAVGEADVQRVRGEAGRSSFPAITVQKGIPVEFTLVMSRENYTGCNNALIIPQLGLAVALSVGDNVIRFTPTETGVISYTCWMGMIKSTITVVDDITQTGAATQPPEQSGSPASIPHGRGQ